MWFNDGAIGMLDCLMRPLAFQPATKLPFESPRVELGYTEGGGFPEAIAVHVERVLASKLPFFTRFVGMTTVVAGVVMEIVAVLTILSLEIVVIKDTVSTVVNMVVLGVSVDTVETSGTIVVVVVVVVVKKSDEIVATSSSLIVLVYTVVYEISNDVVSVTLCVLVRVCVESVGALDVY